MRYEFFGSVSFAEQGSESDFDSMVFHHLSEQSSSIGQEIRSRLRQHLPGRARVGDVEIHFSLGSVELFGFVDIMVGMSVLGGALGFMREVGDLVRWIVQMVIADRVNNLPVPRSSSVIVRVPVPVADQDEVAEPIARIPLRRLLVAWTGLNLVLLFGGSVLGGVLIPSTLRDYSAAQQQVDEAVRMYDRHSREAELLAGSLRDDVRRTRERIAITSSRVDSAVTDARELSRRVMSLKESVGGDVDIVDLWRISTWSLRILGFFVFSMGLTVAAGLIFAGIARVRRW